MARTTSFTKTKEIKHKPKSTRQGRSHNTKLSASSKNFAKKKYRGQGH
jgi:hypothetical protein